MTQMVKHLPAMQETQDGSLGQEDPLEKGMATSPVFLPGESHGQEPGGQQSICSQKIRHNGVIKTFTYF